MEVLTTGSKERLDQIELTYKTMEAKYKEHGYYQKCGKCQLCNKMANHTSGQ